MDLSSWQAQLRKGAAELAVLAMLRDCERYGLQILEGVNASSEIVTEGAMYPLLNRLEREGKVKSRWTVEEAAHPRKYYCLTNDGAEMLLQMTAAWHTFKTAMADIVETCS